MSAVISLETAERELKQLVEKLRLGDTITLTTWDVERLERASAIAPVVLPSAWQPEP